MNDPNLKNVRLKNAKLWWTVFAICAPALIGGLLWLSHAVLAAERADLADRAQEERSANARIALWRLDAWLGGFLSREAARSHLEYEIFPSPLAGFRSDYIRIHFQLDAEGRLTSPQPLHGAANADLKILAEALEESTLEQRLRDAETSLDRRLDDAGWPGFTPELSRRAAAGAQCLLPGETPPILRGPEYADIGPFLPLWLDRGPDVDGPEFVFVRRVERSGEVVFQGFLGRWQLLQRALTAEIADLVPEADLRPFFADAGPLVKTVAESGPEMLATLPAILHRPPTIASQPVWTPARAKLAAIWSAALIALAAIGWTLRASIGFGRRRQRFASAMAHELRTPLTTFQMYTEMLADGTIENPQQRQEYLDMLQDEARRLSGLVENVLLHAGLEDRSSPRPAELRVAEMLDRITPTLDRRAKAAGLQLEVDAEAADAPIAVDLELLERLLFNLVDNACKYAAEAKNATIRLSAKAQSSDLILRVRDHGPGVPPAQRRKIFQPFFRGEQASGPQPGAGLGLALARDLARASGGDLILDPLCSEGACFELRLPVLV